MQSSSPNSHKTSHDSDSVRHAPHGEQTRSESVNLPQLKVAEPRVERTIEQRLSGYGSSYLAPSVEPSLLKRPVAKINIDLEPKPQIFEATPVRPPIFLSRIPGLHQDITREFANILTKARDRNDCSPREIARLCDWFIHSRGLSRDYFHVLLEESCERLGVVMPFACTYIPIDWMPLQDAKISTSVPSVLEQMTRKNTESILVVAGIFLPDAYDIRMMRVKIANWAPYSGTSRDISDFTPVETEWSRRTAKKPKKDTKLTHEEILAREDALRQIRRERSKTRDSVPVQKIPEIDVAMVDAALQALIDHASSKVSIVTELPLDGEEPASLFDELTSGGISEEGVGSEPIVETAIKDDVAQTTTGPVTAPFAIAPTDDFPESTASTVVADESLATGDLESSLPSNEEPELPTATDETPTGVILDDVEEGLVDTAPVEEVLEPLAAIDSAPSVRPPVLEMPPLRLAPPDLHAVERLMNQLKQAQKLDAAHIRTACGLIFKAHDITYVPLDEVVDCLIDELPLDETVSIVSTAHNSSITVAPTAKVLPPSLPNEHEISRIEAMYLRPPARRESKDTVQRHIRESLPDDRIDRLARGKVPLVVSQHIDFDIDDDGIADDTVGDESTADDLGFNDKVDFEQVDFDGLGINPYVPTEAKPGSEEKVLTLVARYEAGLPLWDPDDSYDHNPFSGASVSKIFSKAMNASAEKPTKK